MVLRVKHLCQAGVFEDISFELRQGEILGMAGLVGRVAPMWRMLSSGWNALPAVLLRSWGMK